MNALAYFKCNYYLLTYLLTIIIIFIIIINDKSKVILNEKVTGTVNMVYKTRKSSDRRSLMHGKKAHTHTHSHTHTHTVGGIYCGRNFIKIGPRIAEI